MLFQLFHVKMEHVGYRFISHRLVCYSNSPDYAQQMAAVTDFFNPMQRIG